MSRAAAFLFVLAFSLPLAGADSEIQRHIIRGLSLEGNLSGDSPDRLVAVYLPPAYEAEPDRRFPVVYLLHGFTDSVEDWWFSSEHWINLPTVLDRAFAREDVRDAIVVMPDAFNRFQGSMYSNSVTIGDWETYVAEEVVAYVDSHFRTLPERASRGLAGHSMGGYGAMRIGMKRPDVFSSVYLLSPCCLAPASPERYAGRDETPWEDVTTDEQIAAAGFGTKAVLASAAAWAPNPNNPPLYLDLPTDDGEVRPDVVARFIANAPLAQIDQYIGNLRRLEAFAFDAGDEDRSIAAAIRELDGVLTRYGLDHGFAIYPGDHINGVAQRIEAEAMPFFTRHLEFDE